MQVYSCGEGATVLEDFGLGGGWGCVWKMVAHPFQFSTDPKTAVKTKSMKEYMKTRKNFWMLSRECRSKGDHVGL